MRNNKAEKEKRLKGHSAPGADQRIRLESQRIRGKTEERESEESEENQRIL